jgi:hypothetical protein
MPVNRGSWISFTPEKAPNLKVVLWIGQKEAGIFVRAHSSLTTEDFRDWIGGHIPEIERRLGIENRSGDGTELGQTIGASIADPATWPAAQDWQERELGRYMAVLDAVAEKDLGAA